jgi:hypothetical protein
MWAPVRGKRVAAWSNVAVSQDEVEWQDAQLVENPAAACGGSVVAAYFA